jgi:hypothetical protein
MSMERRESQARRGPWRVKSAERGWPVRMAVKASSGERPRVGSRASRHRVMRPREARRRCWRRMEGVETEQIR